MSEQAKSARSAMKAKAKRMCEGTKGKVDASDWDPNQTFSAEKKREPVPKNPREYKRGGKVVEHVEGRARAEHHAGKAKRHPTHGCRVGNAESANYLGGTRPTGGRIARKHGGKAKGKTNINIIIGGGHRDAPPSAPPPQPGPIHPPGMFPPGMPPAGAAPPMPMPPPGAPGMAGMMPRKSGGRARSYKDMTAGAGTAEGRIQKSEIAERD